ncbi:hypothetical protein FB562_0224 [Homoserinimonas aerilata]|uniref:YCII-related domain-containing protein n=1 Tax=Homoserinimonas aerilata TaxID=1162970 RepID=A0A542YGF4_9MICO|nr:hypothetical protein [Homoserinimonas aerilata]TQL47173.1 hypothetical protein FB562_0224 [Homoserinimonas aerilata]
MRFMIMVFGEEQDVHARPPEWAERLAAFMVQLEDELAFSGELVSSEVLEFGESATLVDRHGGRHRGSFTGNKAPLTRFWLVKVPDAERAFVIAGRVAEVVGGAVEVRRAQEETHRP